MTSGLNPIRAGIVPIETWSPAIAATESFRYVDIGSVDRESKRIVGVAELQVSDAPSRARQILKAMDVLVSTVRPNLNAVAMVPTELDGAVASTGFTVLRTDPQRLDSRFLFYWVRTPGFVREMTKRASGASYPAVSDRIVLDSSMPMPTLDEQRRSADILEKADAIRHKRKDVIAIAADLPRSAFLELFGDPVTNPKKWDVRPLGEVAEAASGVTKGKRYEGPRLVTLPYMRVANVQDGHLVLDDVKTITVSEEDAQRYRLESGDLLLTEGGDADKLGRGTVWRGEIQNCIHQNHIFRVRPGPLVRSEYLSAIVSSALGKRYFMKAAKQTTGIATINMTQLKAFPVLVPPKSLQEDYVAVVDRSTRLRTTLQERDDVIDDLFRSLVARAFAGRLVGMER